MSDDPISGTGYETPNYEAPPPAQPTAPAPPCQPPPERFPFWGYQDLMMLIGFAVVGMIGSLFAVRAVLAMFHVTVRNQVLEMLPEQFLGYLCLFVLVALMFRVQYGRPFWPSMGWTPTRTATGAIVAQGVLLAIGVAFAGVLLKTPDIPTPMSKLLADRTSVLLVAIFGITAGPMCEELIFRGFLQPLVVRTFGPPAGILLAALAFGLMHVPEYGNSWRHGLLISLTGVAFGWMRHRTGSTRASTLMHAAYNATFFAVMLAQWKNLPHGP